MRPRKAVAIDPQPPPIVLPQSVGVEFIHALVDVVARRADCRVLHVKGPIAAGQLGLRRRRSGDVDVWIAPDDRADMILALEALGWAAADQPRSRRTVEHATVLVHQDWGCAIDLHHRFPGIGIDPRRAFDLLWSSREEATIAGQALPVPARAAHALVVLLHAARGHGAPRARQDVQQVIATLDHMSVAELRTWAVQLDCGPALAAVVPAWAEGNRRLESLHWRVRAGDRGTSGVQVWISRILASRGMRQRAALLWAAALPDQVTMERRAGRSLSTPALLGAWLGRWIVGVRRAPSALAGLLRPTSTVTVPLDADAPAADPLPHAAHLPEAHAWTEAEGLTWIAELLTPRLFALTPTAAQIWIAATRLLSVDGRVSTSAVVDAVATAAGGDALDIEAEVTSTLETLCELGLLDSPGPPVINALGTAVALHVEPDFAGRLRAQWARCLTTDDPEHTLDLRGYADADAREYDAAWQLTLHGIMRLIEPGPARAGHGTRLNLHSAGLADRSGSVLALVGRSGSGKTTAAAVLGRQLGYVTDECVSVDLASLRVLSYPKPLSVVAEPTRPGTKVQRGPDELGLKEPPDDLRLGAVVLLRRSPQPITPKLTRVPIGEALMELAPQISGLARMATPLRAIAELLERTGGALRLDYGEIGEAAQLLTDLLRGRQRQHDDAEARADTTVHHGAPDHRLPPAPPPDRWETSLEAVTSDTWLLRRRWWADAIETEDQLVVYDGQRPILLEDLGRTVWLALGSQPQTFADVHRQVTEVLGPHPDSRELLRIAISTLADAHLLAVVPNGTAVIRG